ncbi:MAG: respiratory nitrate reductase subunit gamma [Acidobacteria bacterium]|nr:respiratory nitrate reductase subunit gamma [Acidobacteriota bacterium]
MTTLLYAMLCLSAVVCVAATVVRAVGYARAPMHLRWELYPVPHEASDRAAHGGSYFEDSNWWTKPPHFNLRGELTAMFTEMLFLKALREFNLRLWWRSFPFHVGLYLLITTVALLLGTAVATVFVPAWMTGWLGRVVYQVCRATGVGGLVLAMVGAAGLVHRRLTDSDLRMYSTPGDIFNLVAFLVALGVVAAGYAFRPAGSPGALGIVIGLLTWDTTIRVPGLLAAGLLLSALLAAYVPFTHMSHFVGKYFTYHAVRWDDRVNRRGGTIERTLAEYLTYRPTWSAPHVTADGSRSWADIATTNPTKGTKR